LLLVVACALERKFRPLIHGGTAMAFGFGLAAFYILPAAFEQRWVQITQVMSENLSYAQNFIFTHSIDPEFAHDGCVVSGGAFNSSAERGKPEPALDLGGNGPGAVALVESDLLDRGAAKTAARREE